MLSDATLRDVSTIATLRAAVAERLTTQFGKGHWSSPGDADAVLRELRTPGSLVARRGNEIVAALRLAPKKPWAIDPAYFTPCASPLYLTGMAVDPALQRQGIGRQCVEELVRIAARWGADAIRLDAYDHAAGAGGFYAKCGFSEVARVVYRKTPLVYYERLL